MVTVIGDSIPVPHTSPSPCAAWQSPIEKSAPGTNTGSRAVEPATRSLVSMFPRWRAAGTAHVGQTVVAFRWSRIAITMIHTPQTAATRAGSER